MENEQQPRNGIQRSLNKALHLTAEETEHIMESLLANFSVFYVDDLTEGIKEVEDKISGVLFDWFYSRKSIWVVF